ncbi:MAG: hypothetical protein Q7S44_04300 [bacterium]|nr:hypothetical protein [bacterium]
MEILQMLQNFQQGPKDPMEFGASCLKSAERRVRSGWNNNISIVFADRSGMPQLTVPMIDNKDNVLDFTEAEVDQLVGERWLLGEHGEIEGRWVVCDGGRKKRVLEYNGSSKGDFSWILRKYTLDNNSLLASIVSSVRLEWVMIRSGLYA